jgi:YihY family inner membrane protein
VPDVGAWVRRIDRFQQRRALTALPVAVVKKHGDDRGPGLAAQLTYYGFLALFPLLLVLTTIVGFVGNDEVSDSVVGRALAQFPVLGEQIGRNVAHPLRGSGIGLVVGLAVLLYGALGATQAAQHAMAQVWNVPNVERPGFGARLARGLAVFGALGIGLAAGAGAGGLVTMAGDHGAWRAVAFLVLVVFDVVMYLVVMRLLTPGVIETRALVPGAIVGGIAYSILLTIGTALVQHQLRDAQAVYGQFAFVLGLVGWLFLLAQVSLYAAELNVVVARRLWPRGIAAPLTAADRAVLASLARQEARRPEEVVEVGFPQPS